MTNYAYSLTARKIIINGCLGARYIGAGASNKVITINGIR